MILTVNIGNTHITDWRLRTRHPADSAGGCIPSPAATVDEYAMRPAESALAYIGASPERIEGGILGSVVPALTGRVLGALRMFCSARFLTVGPGLKSGIKLRLDNPAQLGAELLCGAVAALAGGARTAGGHLGRYRHLHHGSQRQTGAGGRCHPARAAAFPFARWCKKLPSCPRSTSAAPASSSILGKNTSACLQNGFVLGTAGLLDGLAERFRQSLARISAFMPPATCPAPSGRPAARRSNTGSI